MSTDELPQQNTDHQHQTGTNYGGVNNFDAVINISNRSAAEAEQFESEFDLHK